MGATIVLEFKRGDNLEEVARITAVMSDALDMLVKACVEGCEVFCAEARSHVGIQTLIDRYHQDLPEEWVGSLQVFDRRKVDRRKEPRRRGAQKLASAA